MIEWGEVFRGWAGDVIKVDNLSIRQGDFTLKDVSFEVPQGAYAVLMGRTGCGKTTVLETICGLRKLLAGSITLLGDDVTGVKPGHRGIGYVPQERSVFSTMSVRDNLAFALTIRKWTKPAIAARVAELAGLLGIEHLLDRLPVGLSGGESQRISLGRALAAYPRVLCLDEPLSALDDETREEMYELLETVKVHSGVTTLHVTHNHDEAKRLADLVLLFKNGRVEAAAMIDDKAVPSSFSDSPAAAPVE